MYFWFKAFHFISLICWFAGLFYLFRLYVYHVEAQEEVVRERFKIMERRLYNYITTPAMISTFIFGGIMVFQLTNNLKDFFEFPWLYIKLLFVFGLFLYHIYDGIVLKQLKEDRCKLTSKQCRILNEVPTLFLIAIVLLATLKPF